MKNLIVVWVVLTVITACKKESKTTSGDLSVVKKSTRSYDGLDKDGWPLKFNSLAEFNDFKKEKLEAIPTVLSKLKVNSDGDDADWNEDYTEEPGSGDCVTGEDEDNLFGVATGTEPFAGYMADLTFGKKRFVQYIDAQYAARAITIRMRFAIDAAAPVGTTTYMNPLPCVFRTSSQEVPTAERFELLGEAVGILSEPDFNVDIIPESGSESKIDVAALEQRVLVRTTTNSKEIHLGKLGKYIQGFTMENGSTVETSSNTNTDYDMHYKIYLFNTGFTPYLGHIGGDLSYGFDITGSTITGIPRNY